MVQADVQNLSENHLRDAMLNSFSKYCRVVPRYEGTRMIVR